MPEGAGGVPKKRMPSPRKSTKKLTTRKATQHAGKGAQKGPQNRRRKWIKEKREKRAPPIFSTDEKVSTDFVGKKCPELCDEKNFRHQAG